MVYNGLVTPHSLVSCLAVRFLLGPPNMADKTNIGRIPKVHLSTSNTDDEAEQCFLIVYRLFSATICLLIEGQFHFLLLLINITVCSWLNL